METGVKQCTHARKGIVTNQPEWLSQTGSIGLDLTKPHAARACCDREDCIKAAKRWVAGEVNGTAYYVPDADRSVRL